MSLDANVAIIGSSLSCNGCGAKLQYTPGTRQLTCEHCGGVNDLTTATHGNGNHFGVIFESFLSKTKSLANPSGAQQIKCSGCGAESVLPREIMAGVCSSCASPLVLDLNHSESYVRPHYILPFKITRDDAAKAFEKKARSIALAPNNLIESINRSESRLQGFYLPQWLFDADVNTRFTGQRGDHYYITESYKDADGNTKTREVQKIRWTPVSGSVDTEFEDITAPATKSLPVKTMNDLGPWQYGEFVPFDERYLSGFVAQSFQINPWTAREFIAPAIRDGVERDIIYDIGGDKQKITSSNSTYNKLTIKYVLLPVWMSSFTYNNKTYQYTVNANTGEVIGKFPRSAAKIIAICAIILAAIIGIYLSGGSPPAK